MSIKWKKAWFLFQQRLLECWCLQSSVKNELSFSALYLFHGVPGFSVWLFSGQVSRGTWNFCVPIPLSWKQKWRSHKLQQALNSWLSVCYWEGLCLGTYPLCACLHVYPSTAMHAGINLTWGTAASHTFLLVSPPLSDSCVTNATLTGLSIYQCLLHKHFMSCVCHCTRHHREWDRCFWGPNGSYSLLRERNVT